MKSFLLFAIGLMMSIIGFSQHKKLDSLNLNDVVITENRLQIPFNKSTRNIRIISKKELDLYAAKSINELLAYLGGVDIRQRGPFGTQTDVSVDGGSFEQTLILINGVKVSDVQTAHNSMNIPVPIEAIERIEVLKGPAARVYGVNALTGAINIVTSQSDVNFLNVHNYVGSSFKSKDVADGNGVYYGGGMNVTANYFNKNFNNFLSISKEDYNGQRYNTASKNVKLYYKGEAKFDDNNSLNFSTGYIKNEFGANGFYAAPGDLNSMEIVETLILNVETKHQITDRFILKPRISNRYNEDDYRYNKYNLNTGRSMHFSNVLSAEINSSYLTSFGDFGFGIESRKEEINSSNIGDHNRFNHGLYAEFNTQLGNQVLLNTGAYLNYNTAYKWQVLPGLDLSYQPHPNWKFNFTLGSSQRIPSFTDLYLNQRPANIGNPNLLPEQAWQYDGSLTYSKNNSQLKFGYFYRDINQFIDWMRVGVQNPFQPQNIVFNKMHGLNFNYVNQLRFNDKHFLNFNLSYNYLLPKIHNEINFGTSKYVLENLKHQAVLNLNYKIKNWSFSVNNRFVKRELNSSYFIQDLRFNRVINKVLLYVDVTNVYNQIYIETGAVPLPSRWYALGIKYNII